MGKEYQVGIAADIFKDFLKPSRYKALFGGRGSAKSHFFAEAMIANASTTKGFRAVCVREVQKSLKESAKRLLEDKINSMGKKNLFEIQNDCIKTPGDGIIIFQGLQDHTAQSITSLEGFNIAWCEESASLSQKSLELLRPTIRTPNSELWFSWNPRSATDPVDKFFRNVTPPENAIIRQVNFDQNKFFPAELEAEREFDERTNPDRYAHIWLGHYEPQAQNAIFNRQNIHANRVSIMPVERERTLVGIDPAVSNTERSDEHGISVCCKGSDGRGYVIADGSTRGAPHEWARRAVSLFDKFDGDGIVVEINQGGDMVKHTLQTVRNNIPVIEVRATRGKHVRAEPISALYNLDMVSHVGTFDKLEDQLCKFTSEGYEGSDSPDRAESAIWAFTELFPELLQGKPREKENYYQPPPSSGGWMS